MILSEQDGFFINRDDGLEFKYSTATATVKKVIYLGDDFFLMEI
jgi:uncharacterized protein with PIN domain